MAPITIRPNGGPAAAVFFEASQTQIKLGFYQGFEAGTSGRAHRRSGHAVLGGGLRRLGYLTIF